MSKYAPKRIFNPLHNPRATKVIEEVHTVIGQIRKETANAILFRVKYSIKEDDWEDIWFPLSQVKKIVTAVPTDNKDDSLTVTAWIARQKGLID